MFIGHFGVGFAGKAAARRVSLGTLFIAAQFLDLLWPTLVLLGIERVRIVPGITTVTPLAFDYYPISHSLLAVAGWAVLVAVIHFLLKRDRGAAIVLGLLVISHWLLDLVVHRPDLPLYPGASARYGLDLWASLPGTLVVELSLFALGVWLYARSTRAVDRIGRWGLRGLVLLLLVIYFGNLFGSPPPSARAIGWIGELQWLLVLLGYWIDSHRSTRFS